MSNPDRCDVEHLVVTDSLLEAVTVIAEGAICQFGLTSGRASGGADSSKGESAPGGETCPAPPPPPRP